MGALDDLLQQKQGGGALQSLLDAQAPQEQQFGLSDTWPIRLAKGAYESAKDAFTLPGDVYAGRQDVNSPDITGRALNFAIMASPAAGAGTKIPVSPRPVQGPSESALMGAGAKAYDEAFASPVAMNGNVVSQWAKYAQNALRRKGFFDTNNSAPTTFTILKGLEKDGVGNGLMSATDQGSPALFAGDYVNLRSALQAQARDFSSPKESAAATLAIKQLDALWDKTPASSFVAGTPTEIGGIRSSLKDARANFAAGYRSKLISGKEREADLRSVAANSGANYDNTLRQRLAGVLIKEANAPSGFTPEELAAIQKVPEGTTARNTTRQIGNMMGGGRGVAAGLYTVAPAIAAGVGTGDLGSTLSAALLGATIPATGAALKGIENHLTKKQVSQLGNMLRLRSPLGQRALDAAPPLPGAIPSGAQFTYRTLLNPFAVPQPIEDYIAQNPNQS